MAWLQSMRSPSARDNCVGGEMLKTPLGGDSIYRNAGGEEEITLAIKCPTKLIWCCSKYVRVDP